jgi:hypothetical protein
MRKRSTLLAAVAFCLAAVALAAVARADRTESVPTKASSTKKHKPKRGAKATPPTVSLACTVDADCALTRLGDRDCCPKTCQPRAVAKASAEALERYNAACRPAGGCPDLSCPPPRQDSAPACVDGRCTVRAVSRE